MSNKTINTWSRPWIVLAHAALDLAIHTIVAIFIIAMITVLERITHYILDNNTLFLGRFPIQYIFDFADFSVLITFAAQSVMRLLSILRGEILEVSGQNGEGAKSAGMQKKP